MSLEKLNDIMTILLSVRQTGQTTIATNSLLSNSQALLVVGNCQMKHVVATQVGISTDRIITVEQLTRLRGINVPLVWDNTAIIEIIYLLNKEIERRAEDIPLDEDGYPTEYAR